MTTNQFNRLKELLVSIHEQCEVLQFNKDLMAVFAENPPEDVMGSVELFDNVIQAQGQLILDLNEVVKMSGILEKYDLMNK